MGEKELTREVKRIEKEMLDAARNLEFERAAAIRDELRTLRLGVLGDDRSRAVQRGAERAAVAAEDPSSRRSRRDDSRASAGDRVAHRVVAPALDSAADWLPGLRDVHDEGDDAASDTLPDVEGQRSDAAPSAPRRSTWDPSVTPNVIKRRGERPRRRR